jgi:hypothetical protein
MERIPHLSLCDGVGFVLSAGGGGYGGGGEDVVHAAGAVALRVERDV